MSEVVVISGVAGMTGSKVAEFLLKKGIVVLGFDNFFCGSREVINRLSVYKNFVFFEYDICNQKQMDDLFKFIRNSFSDQDRYLLNCAAVVHTKHFYHPDDTFQTNVIAMKDILERCIKDGFKRYINCSTSEIYSMKSFEDGGVKESDAVLMATAEQSLRTSYAAGKLLTEFFMKDAVEQQHIKGCSIRFANVYSADELYDDHIIPHIISSLQKTHSVILLENAKETRRTFLNNHDSCLAVLKLLFSEEALDGSVYNVGTTEEIYILDLVKKIAELMNIEDYKIEFNGVRTADPRRRLLNVDKIFQKVGWKPEVSLIQGLKECIQNRLNRVC